MAWVVSAVAHEGCGVMPFVADPGGIGIWTCVLLVTALLVIGGFEETFC